MRIEKINKINYNKNENNRIVWNNLSNQLFDVLYVVGSCDGI